MFSISLFFFPPPQLAFVSDRQLIALLVLCVKVVVAGSFKDGLWNRHQGQRRLYRHSNLTFSRIMALHAWRNPYQTYRLGVDRSLMTLRHYFLLRYIPSRPLMGKVDLLPLLQKSGEDRLKHTSSSICTCNPKLKSHCQTLLHSVSHKRIHNSASHGHSSRQLQTFSCPGSLPIFPANTWEKYSARGC